MIQDYFILVISLISIWAIIKETSKSIENSDKVYEDIIKIDEQKDFVNFKRFILNADTDIMLDISYQLIILYEKNYKNEGNVSTLYKLYEKKVADFIT